MSAKMVVASLVLSALQALLGLVISRFNRAPSFLATPSRGVSVHLGVDATLPPFVQALFLGPDSQATNLSPAVAAVQKTEGGQVESVHGRSRWGSRFGSDFVSQRIGHMHDSQ